MDIFKSEEEVVVIADNYHAFIARGAHIFYSKQLGCAIYLYFILESSN